jgi:hypothetical protein
LKVLGQLAGASERLRKLKKIGIKSAGESGHWRIYTLIHMNNTKKCIEGNNERKGRKKQVKAKYL